MRSDEDQQSAPAAEPDEVPALFSRVVELLHQHQQEKGSAASREALDRAMRELEQFHLTNPESVPSLRLLAECSQRLGNLAAARVYISQAELLEPWDLDILIISESFYEAEAADEHQKFGEAPHLQPDLSSMVVDSDKLIQKAMGSFRLGDLERAYTLAKLAFVLAPEQSYHLMDVLAVGSSFAPNRLRSELIQLEQQGDAPAYLYLALGSVCNVLGLYTEASYWLNQGIGLSPEDPYVLSMLYNELAYVMAKQKTNLDRCVSIARMALDLFPDKTCNGFIRDTLGVTYLKKGDLDKAVSNLREAVSKDPTVIPRFHLALALLHRRDTAGALNELKFIAGSRPSLESPHIEETAILERVQTHINRLEDLLNLGGADDVRDALEILSGLV